MNLNMHCLLKLESLVCRFAWTGFERQLHLLAQILHPTAIIGYNAKTADINKADDHCDCFEENVRFDPMVCCQFWNGWVEHKELGQRRKHWLRICFVTIQENLKTIKIALYF